MNLLCFKVRKSSGKHQNLVVIELLLNHVIDVLLMVPNEVLNV